MQAEIWNLTLFRHLLISSINSDTELCDCVNLNRSNESLPAILTFVLTLPYWKMSNNYIN